MIGLVEYEPGQFRELMSGPARAKELAKSIGMRSYDENYASTPTRPTHVQVACQCVGARRSSCAGVSEMVSVDGLAQGPRYGTASASLASALQAVCLELARTNCRLEELARKEPTIERLTTAPSVGLVVAAAFVSVVDEARRFDGAHQLESYLGLVPREASTGGKRKLGSITKQGNPYMRQLLVQSATGILRVGDAEDPLRRWGRELVARRGRKIAVVAVARRLAGILWAMWRKGTVYEPARLGGRANAGQDASVEPRALKNAAKKAHFRTRDADDASILFSR